MTIILLSQLTGVTVDACCHMPATAAHNAYLQYVLAYRHKNPRIFLLGYDTFASKVTKYRK